MGEYLDMLRRAHSECLLGTPRRKCRGQGSRVCLGIGGAPWGTFGSPKIGQGEGKLQVRL